MLFVNSTWRYLSWRAAGESPITSLASRKARDAFCSPSAAITLARASRAASASAAIARCNWMGRRTSFLYIEIEVKHFNEFLIEDFSRILWIYLHFDSFNFDTPCFGDLIQLYLHSSGDGLTFTENFMKMTRTHRISQRCLSQ